MPAAGSMLQRVPAQRTRDRDRGGACARSVVSTKLFGEAMSGLSKKYCGETGKRGENQLCVNVQGWVLGVLVALYRTMGNAVLWLLCFHTAGWASPYS